MVLAGVVLCGGAGTRMRRDKSLIEIDGETLISRTSRRLAEVADPVFVAAGDRRYGVEYEHLPDAAPDSGPLGGIASALRASPHLLLAVVAVDMPFASAPLLSLLADLHTEEDLVVPRDDFGLQPLHAVYAGSALPHIESALGRRELSMNALMDHLGIRIVEPDEWSAVVPGGRFAYNVNDPSDLEGL